MAPGLCSGSDPVFSWKWTGPGKDEFPIAGNRLTEMVTPATWIHTSTVTFQATPSQHLTNVTCKVSFRNNISTEETVTLNINCEYFPSCLFQIGIILRFIFNFRTDNKYKPMGLLCFFFFKVSPRISKKSGCKIQSDIMTCVCISQGVPLPTITWPLLENHTEYLMITTVSDSTVNSTINLSVRDYSHGVPCASSNSAGTVQQNLDVIRTPAGDNGESNNSSTNSIH